MGINPVHGENSGEKPQHILQNPHERATNGPVHGENSGEKPQHISQNPHERATNGPVHGENIQRLRVEKGFTQEKLADLSSDLGRKNIIWVCYNKYTSTR